MIKTILVPVTGDDSDDPALRTAATVARLFTAHLEVIFCRADPTETLVMAGAGDMAAGVVTADLLDDLEKREEARLGRARRTFDEFCRREDIKRRTAPAKTAAVSVAWRESVGNAVERITLSARANDLVVLARPAADRGLPLGTVGSILIGSGRPLLLAPPEPPKEIARTVVVAWKDSAEAARAVSAAMPLLGKAKKIAVLSIGESARQDKDAAEGVALQLRWHGLNATSRTIAAKGQRGPEALLAAARRLKADLIVMGAYGHSRARELIFGGFTRAMLQDADLPVFALH